MVGSELNGSRCSDDRPGLLSSHSHPTGHRTLGKTLGKVSRLGGHGDLLHDPAVHVTQHLRAQFVTAGILSKRDGDSRGVEKPQVVARLIGAVDLAVAAHGQEDRQATCRHQSPKRLMPSREAHRPVTERPQNTRAGSGRCERPWFRRCRIRRETRVSPQYGTVRVRPPCNRRPGGWPPQSSAGPGASRVPGRLAANPRGAAAA